MTIYRQGDVLITACEEIPAGAAEIEREGGRIVLAHGEATGHAHAIREPDARLLTQDGRVFLDLSAGPAVVVHEEHAPIELPAGSYRVIRQREYQPDAIRIVAD